MRLLTELADLFFPGVCILCGKDLSGKSPVCGECLAKVPPIPYDTDIAEARAFDGLFYRAPYSGIVRDLLKAYKYTPHPSLSGILSDLAAELLETFPPPPNAVLTAVPMTFSSLREKGFDHMKRLLESSSKKTGIPSLDLLEVVKQRRHQASSANEQRKSQVTGKYGVRLKELYRTSGTVLLLDDVYTTGATVGECAEVLKKAGASKVFVYTLARVLKESKTSPKR